MSKVKQEVTYVSKEMTAAMPTAEVLAKKVNAQKKVKGDGEIQDNLVLMLNYIKYFNCLDENVSIVFGNTDINKVQVLDEFSDFIIPAAVRLDPTNLRSKNLVIKEAEVDAPGDFNQYVDLCDTIRGYFKKDAASGLVPLVNCKKPVNLQSVIHRASCLIDGQYLVNYGNDAFYPLRLEVVDKLFEKRHFNATEVDLVADYLSKFQF